MIRRLGLAAAVLGTLLVLDTAAWLVAARVLRGVVLARAAERGIEPGPLAAGGWPWAARLFAPAIVGPGGAWRASGSVALSWADPRHAVAHIERMEATLALGVTLLAVAEDCVIRVPLAEPDRGEVVGHGLRLRGPGLEALAEDFAGTLRPADEGLRLSAEAAAITLPGLPAGVRDWSSASLRAVLAGDVIDSLEVAASGETAGLAFSGRAAPGSVEGVVRVRGLAETLDRLAAARLVPVQAGLAARGIFSVLPRAADGSVAVKLAVADGTISVAGFPVARLPDWVSP